MELVLWPMLLVGALRLTPALYRWAQRWGPRLRSRVLERIWGDGRWSTAVLFALAYFWLFNLVSVPLAVWSHAHELRFGMARGTWLTFIRDWALLEALSALSISAVAIGVFGLARRFVRWWWWVAVPASLVLVASIAIDPYRSRLTLEHHALPDGALRTEILELLSRAEVTVADVVVVESGAVSARAQAAFAGTGPTRTILLSDTLVEAMSHPAVLAAVAHEAAHVRERRWVGRLLSPLGVFALLFFAEWLFRRSVTHGWFGITARGDIRVLPVLVLAVDLFAMAAAPITGLVQRERELEADAYAVTLTSRAAVASLLETLAQVNKSDPAPPRWYVWAGLSHPPLSERLAALGP